MRQRFVLAAVLVLAALVAIPTAFAAKPGNSPNAKLCQKGGWETVFRSDGTSFADEQECVAYGAKGGVYSTRSKSQLDCEGLGGTFGQTDLTGVAFGTVIWSCNDWPTPPPVDGVIDISEELELLENDCLAAGGGNSVPVLIRTDLLLAYVTCEFIAGQGE